MEELIKTNEAGNITVMGNIQVNEQYGKEFIGQASILTRISEIEALESVTRVMYNPVYEGRSYFGGVPDENKAEVINMVKELFEEGDK